MYVGMIFQNVTFAAQHTSNHIQSTSTHFSLFHHHFGSLPQVWDSESGPGMGDASDAHVARLGWVCL